jgi:hypothetical protein
MRAKATPGSAINELAITPRTRLRNADTAITPRPVLTPPAPAGRPVCGARQLFGTRVCDLPPHDPVKTGHVGVGPADQGRAEFWGQR